MAKPILKVTNRLHLILLLSCSFLCAFAEQVIEKDFQEQYIIGNIDTINAIIAESGNKNVGIYENITEYGDEIEYTLAYIQKDENYYLVFIDSDEEDSAWKVGEIRAELRPTADQNIFKAMWYDENKSEYVLCLVAFEGNLMSIVFRNEKYTFIKMANNLKRSQKIGSGTCFALNKGYFITNYHVIEDAKKIEVYGINRNQSEASKVEVVGVDKKCDLALLKISNDSNNILICDIPYSIKEEMAEVGEDVYVLGYPLTTTMGNEVKLTSGIISSRTGYEGDVTLYQISAPIQPGNSGSPLFDTNGNLIGVINAKHADAENANYAIKMSCLYNFVETVADLDILQSINKVSTLSLKDQVKLIEPFIYRIQCYK